MQDKWNAEVKESELHEQRANAAEEKSRKLECVLRREGTVGVDWVGGWQVPDAGDSEGAWVDR